MHTRCTRLSKRLILLLPLFAWPEATADSDVPPSNGPVASDRDASQAKDSGKSEENDTPTLRTSRAIACRSIDGFERYEPLGDAPLTSDEKLLVYYRPDGYKIVRRGSDYVVHFTQDGKIRRRGESVPLRVKLRLLDVESVTKIPPTTFFLRNTVSLKDLAPGDYEFDIILRDENAPGRTATQTLSFRIVRAQGSPAKAEPAPEEGQSDPKPQPKKRRVRRAKNATARG